MSSIARPPRTTESKRRGWAPGLGLWAIGLLLVLSSCSALGNDAQDGMADPDSGAAGGAGAASGDDRSRSTDEIASGVAPGASDGPVGSGEAVGSVGVPNAAEAGRMRVLDTSLDLEVDDVDSARATARHVVREVGGFVEREDIDNSESVAGYDATYRVPPDAAERTASELESMGEVVQGHSDTADVTEELADLDSRLATLAASSDRLRGLITDTGGIDQIVLLEAELTRRESEAASIDAQRRSLGERVAFATISTKVREKLPEPVGSAKASASGFTRGLGFGGDAAKALLAGLLTVAGFLLPFGPVIAVAVLAWLLRRSRRRVRVTPGGDGVS